MSITTTIAHTAETAKGSVKRIAGRLAGSRGPRTEGRADQAKDDIRQAAAKTKDAPGGA
jgi:uncharacterized protein YjbJ (UPF0337 family)